MKLPATEIDAGIPPCFPALSDRPRGAEKLASPVHPISVPGCKHPQHQVWCVCIRWVPSRERREGSHHPNARGPIKCDEGEERRESRKDDDVPLKVHRTLSSQVASSNLSLKALTMAAPTPSSQRVEPGSVNIAPCPWPASTAGESVDVTAVATGIVANFNHALANGDYGALVDLFVEDGYWRDHAALSFDLRTLHGRDKIRAFLEKQCHLTSVELDASSDFRKPNLTNFNPTGKVDGIYFYVNFTTTHGAGRGFVRLIGEHSAFRIWTFFTTLESLKDYPESTGAQRPNGVQHGGTPGRKNWLDRRKEAQEFVDSEPAVLVIGN